MMAEVKGKMLICDVCKKQVFLRWKKFNAQEQYGGWGSYDIYENPPKGWGLSPSSCNITGVKDLCPNCFKVFDDIDKQQKELGKKWEAKANAMVQEAFEKYKKSIFAREEGCGR